MSSQTTESNNGPVVASRIWPVAVATALALVLLEVLFGHQQTEFDTFAFGDAKEVFGDAGGVPFHVQGLEDFPALVKGSQERAAKHQVLWLGNSQLNAVNQYQTGQMSAPGMLFERMSARSVDVLTAAFPNANLQEHYLVFEYLRPRLARLRVLLLPVVFDDFRENGIRPNLLGAMKDPAVVKALGANDVGKRLLTQAAKAQAENEQDVDLGGVRNTLQERSERALNRWLDEHWDFWRLRREARGQLFIWLYRTRNMVFGIGPQSKRPVLKARYKLNMAALKALLASAKRADVRVLVYIVPLRDDVEQPYLASEYERFQKDIVALTKAEGVVFVDLGSLIPGRFWGKKVTTSLSGTEELDFMHFQAPGHKLLTNALADELTSTFREVLE